MHISLEGGRGAGGNIEIQKFKGEANNVITCLSERRWPKNKLQAINTIRFTRYFRLRSNPEHYYNEAERNNEDARIEAGERWEDGYAKDPFRDWDKHSFYGRSN